MFLTTQTKNATTRTQSQQAHFNNNAHLRSPVISRNTNTTVTASRIALLKFPLTAGVALAAMLALAPAPRALAFAQIARGTLDLQTTAQATYESFFIGSPTNDPDWYYSIQPLLIFTRDAGRASINADAGVSVIRYNANTQYNANDPTAALTISIPKQSGAPFDGTLTFAYNETTDIDYALNDRIRTRAYSGGLNFNEQFSDRFAVANTFNYLRNVRPFGYYSTQQIWANDLSLRYSSFLHGMTFAFDYLYTKTNADGTILNPVPLDQTNNSVQLTFTAPIYDTIKGTVGAGYNFFQRTAAETATGTTHTTGAYYLLGIDGPFLPPSLFHKLTGTLSLFYRQATSAGINYNAGRTLTGALTLKWAVRERTTLSLNANRTTTLTATNYTADDTQVGLGVTEKIGDSLTLTANAAYHWFNFRGVDRKQNYADLRFGARYALNRYVTLALDYEFQDNHRTTATGTQPVPNMLGDYTRHVVSFSVVGKF